MQACGREGFVGSTALVRLLPFVLVTFCVGFVGAVVGRALVDGCSFVLDHRKRRVDYYGLRGGRHDQGVCFLLLRIGLGLFGDGGKLG